uniref:Replication protein A C-terminal domain-containing protein n=1 Tax=Chloropicon laureae TaxID=464258 RepID=A0A7S2Z3R3_9CHLO|mmetsp:Transcript_16730/g.37832  ORF Transcript_16730/g.37832 Transcript_16730/m.37832 type:complete len:282 (+) Transcript_16730:91-936(+)
MYGGGDVSASQFAGNAGGFMPGDADAAQQGGRNSGGRGNPNKTLRPFTIKQLRDGFASSDNPVDGITISGQEVSNLMICGKILSIEEKATAAKIIVDDGTGKADVRIFNNGDDDVSGVNGKNSFMADLRVGIYVKVYGCLKLFESRLEVQGYKTRPVTDMNEITFHSLDAIYTHLHSMKKAHGDSFAVGQKRVMAPIGGGMDAAAGVGAMPAMPAGQTATEAANAFFSADNVGEQGLSFDQLRQTLGKKFTEAQLRQAVNDLQNDGFIYTTIDDQHFKGTM